MAEDKDLNKLKEKATQASKAAAKAANEQQKVQQKISSTVKEISGATKGLLDIENDLFDASKKLSGIQLKRLGLQREILKEQLSSLQADKSQLIASSKNFKQVQATAKKVKEIADIEAEALPHRKKLLAAQKELNKFQDKYKKSVDQSLGFIDKIDDKIKEIPVIGDFLSKSLGLDNIKEEIGDKIGGALNKTFKKSAVDQQNAAQLALKGYDSQINKLNGVEDAAGDVTNVVKDIGPELASGAEGAALMETGLISATPAAGGLMAALIPILPIAIAIAAAVMLFKKALDVDKEVTEMARGMGMTKHEALEAHHHFLDIAEDTKIIGANAEAIAAANKDLNAILGTNVIASKEMLEAQVLLTKQYGLSGEEAAAFQSTSAGTGKTIFQNLATVEAMVEGYNTMTGDQVNFKEITKDIAKVSKATLATYKGDVKALTLAAVQAKKMGMSLEDTQAAADKLLDIESSIEAEMKANVLTGKHMNMNAARQLALQGDTAGAIAEAVSQAGDFDEFMSMAPYQQKAIADAAGLTVDQMVKAGELQKYSNALNGVEVKDMKDLTAEQINQLKNQKTITAEKADQLLKDQQIASSQKRMAAITDKLSAMFIKIAEPIVEMLDPLMEIVDFAMPAVIALFKFALAPVMGIFDLIKGIGKLFHGDILGGLKDIGAGIIELFYSPLKFVFDLITGFFPGIKTMLNDALGYITDKIKGLLPDWAISLLNLDETSTTSGEANEATTVHDAMINPSGGLEVSGPKGKFKLDKNDSVIAGTNLSGKDASSNGGILESLSESISGAIGNVSSAVGIGGNSNNKEVASLLRELIAKVDQPVKININGRVMDEIEKQTTLRKTYSTKVDGGYGTFG